MMRVIIAGSRTFADYKLMDKKLRRILADRKDVIVLVGGADGADTLAQKWSLDHWYTVEIHHADWEKYGKAAGPIRNSVMIKTATHLIAFWDGKSRGTKDIIEKAKEKGLQVRVIRYEEGEEE